MVYQWKNYSCIKANAQVAGEQCAELERTVGLTAKNLVDANREETAPLHNEFEWQNDVAAELYREHQARHIIASLCFVVEEQETKEPTECRAFLKVERKEYTYENTPSIMSDEEKRGKMLAIALGELVALKRKYATLNELSNVFNAIEVSFENFTNKENK